jgi:hypothetical protein
MKVPDAQTRSHDDGLRGADSGQCNKLSGKIEAIQVHYLVPGGNKIIYEFLLPVFASIYLGQCAQLRIRSKDQVNSAGCPLDGTRVSIPSFE